MLPFAAYPLPLGVTPVAAGMLVAVAAGAIIFVLVIRYWQAQRLYAMDLADQARQVADEKEKGQQLQQEKEALVRDAQGKSEMLATLSREVRAHLNGIVGSADLLLDGTLTPTQREHLSTLRASAESLHQSLNDILDFSIIETGRLRIETLPFSFRDPLIEVVDHLTPLANLKGLELVLIVAPDIPRHVSGDPARIRQILFNLVSNSVRFTSSGRVVLRAVLPPGTAPTSSESATWVQFSVSDTGESIPEDLMPTIFDRFVQSSSPSPRKFGGSGLDLAIAKRLTELMGGRIGVRALPETGVEFWVVLPLIADRVEIATAPAPVQGMHVVVVDDVAAARVAISSLLSMLGVDQDAADTVTEAAHLLHDAQELGAQDLVLLLDESVADARGDELCRLLRSEEYLRSARIILMTVSPDSVREKRYAFPLAGVLKKPVVRTDQLLRALKAPPQPELFEGAAPTPARVEPARPAGPARRVPHVLVVDDDEISRSVTSQLLERLGCQVDRAVSGAEALERTRRTKFDLIFMDCVMPEMDGFVTTERILTDAGREAPPIVALTASTTVRDREKCFAAGMTDFVDKPARKVELERILKRWTRSDANPATG